MKTAVLLVVLVALATGGNAMHLKRQRGSGRRRTTTTTTEASTDTTTYTGLTDAEIALFYNDNECAELEVTGDSENLYFKANGIPDHAWEATNGNELDYVDYDETLPRNAEDQTYGGCLNGGPIGFAKNGLPIYSPLTSSNVNAVEGTTQENWDEAGGHASPNNGAYHYHYIPNWFDQESADEFFGVALDGLPIYGAKTTQSDGSVETYTSSDLDRCHGKVGADGRYKYHMTTDFPYILGCYHAKVYSNQVTYNCDSVSGQICTCQGGVLDKDDVTSYAKKRLVESENHSHKKGLHVRAVEDSCNPGTSKKRTLNSLKKLLELLREK